MLDGQISIEIGGESIPLDGIKARIIDEALAGYVERIERIEGQRREMADDVKSIYREAQGVGFNPRALRQIIADRRKDPDRLREMENDLIVYRRALDKQLDLLKE